jgi:hypothetical protein
MAWGVALAAVVAQRSARRALLFWECQMNGGSGLA